jgi:hypothetical protein
VSTQVAIVLEQLGVEQRRPGCSADGVV